MALKARWLIPLGKHKATFFAIGPVLNNHLILVITATIPGGTDREVTQLNIESLWSGGPFEDPVSNDSLLILGSN